MLKRLSILAICLSLISLSAFAGKNNKVYFQSGTYSFSSSSPDILNPAPDEIVDGYFYRLIQFNDVRNTSEHNIMQSYGIQFLDYIPHNTYLVAIPVGITMGDLSYCNIRSIQAFDAQYKMDKYLSGLQPIPAYAVDGSERVFVNMLPMDGLSASELSSQLIEMKATAINIEPTRGLIQASIDLDEIETFAALPYIKFMEVGDDPGSPESEDGKAMHRANFLNSQLPGGLTYDGSGVSVSINDDGFAGPHIDFENRTDQSDVAGDFTGDHGDMTCGIIAGAGNLDPTIQGMAPGSFLWVRQYSASMPSTPYLHNTEGVMVFSTSYSNGCNAGYTTVTELVDQEINTDPSILQVFSAGNSNGTNCGYGAGSSWGNVTGGHKIAKNVMAVANLYSDEVLVGSSSRGPAEDGRIKPDIASHGQGQMSTDPNNGYASGGGTSAAAPGVGGVAAQLYEAYKDLNGGTLPESALIKGVLLNSADEMGNVGPDFSYGWGRINGRRAYLTLEENRYMDGTVNNGGTNSHVINVPAGTAQLKVMVIWNDPASSPAAGFDIVNDLDITITQGGSTWMPYVLDHTPSTAALSVPAAFGRDSLNNMEQVVLNSPGAGIYTLNVEGYNVPSGPQKYYMIYEFLTEDVTVTYPLGGEGFVPGETERLRWDAFGNTGAFTAEYSTDNGASWTTISGSIPADQRYVDWVVPSLVTGEALVRISRAGSSDESDANFTIIRLPNNITVDQVCPTTTTISWDAVAGATGYDVYLLGFQYMDSVGSTSGTSFTINGTISAEEDWISVRATGPDGIVGRRAIAVQRVPGLQSCTLGDDIALTDVISPVSGTLSNCFDLSTLPITLEVLNAGSNSQSSFPLYYQLNGGAIVSETYPVTISPSSTNNFSFSGTLDLSAPGTYTFTAWSGLPGDANPYNDTISFTIDVVGTSVGLPFVEDFESFSLCGVDGNCEAEVCNLSNGFRNETNLVVDDIDWRTDENGTFSSGTGPAADHTTGFGSGNYLYLEASGGCTFREANLITPCVDLTGVSEAEMSFWYHMFGPDMGSLHVDVYDGSSWNMDVMTPISGNQGDSWFEAVVNLNAFAGGPILIRFRGITGTEYQSDIAIDDVNIAEAVSAPTADFNYTAPLCENQNITFSENVTGTADSYVWNFGLNAVPSTATGPGPHTIFYTSAGSKSVSLTTTNSIGSDSETKIISVLVAPTAGFTSVVSGLSVDFTNTGSGATTYFWDFGDGNTSTNMSPSHSYTAGGTYNVMMVADNGTCADTVYQNVGVQPDGILGLEVQQFKVYPNPANDKVFVEYQTSAESSLRLYDVTGKQLFGEINQVAGSVKTTIDVTRFSAGVYILEVQSAGYSVNYQLVVE